MKDQNQAPPSPHMRVPDCLPSSAPARLPRPLCSNTPSITQVLTAPRDAQGKEITWRSAAALDGYVRRLSEVREGALWQQGCMLRQQGCCWLAVADCEGTYMPLCAGGSRMAGIGKLVQLQQLGFTSCCLRSAASRMLTHAFGMCFQN